VVLQFALHQRILDEIQFKQQQQEDHSPDQHAMPKTHAWVNSSLLRTMFINWRRVHTGNNRSILENCGLSPSDLLGRIVHLYHKHYQIPLSDKILFLVLDTYVAAVSPSTRPDLAESVLDQSLALWKDGQTACYPQTTFYNLVAYAWIKANLGRPTIDTVTRILQRMNENKVKFDVHTYNYALQMEALRGSEKGAIAAEALLLKIYQEYSSGNESMKVTVQMFACVIQAWANSGSSKAFQRAEEIYHQMLAMRKNNDLKGSSRWDHLAVNAVLRAYQVAVKSDSNMCKQAEDFWRKSGATADHDTYATLIIMYAKCGKLDDIDRLLMEMESSSTPDRDATRIIDRKKIENHAYTAALSAYAKSRIDNKVHRAEALLRRIQQWSKVTTPVYNGTFVNLL
jgi:pentatricopeptide repeat protein